VSTGLGEDDSASATKIKTARRGRRRRGRHAGELTRGRSTKRGLIQGATFHVKEVEYAVVDSPALFEGDIVLGTDTEVQERTEQLRAQMSGAIGLRCRDHRRAVPMAELHDSREQAHRTDKFRDPDRLHENHRCADQLRQLATAFCPCHDDHWRVAL